MFKMGLIALVAAQQATPRNIFNFAIPKDGNKWMHDEKRKFEKLVKQNKDDLYIVSVTSPDGLKTTTFLPTNNRGLDDFKSIIVEHGDEEMFDEVVKTATFREIGFYLLKVEHDIIKFEKLLKALDYDVSKIDPWCQHMLLVVNPFNNDFKDRFRLLFTKTNIVPSMDHREIADRYDKGVFLNPNFYSAANTDQIVVDALRWRKFFH